MDIKWVSVDDRLPEKIDYYLATCKSRPYFCSALRYYKGVWLDERGLEMYWVTHWAILPKVGDE